MNSLRVLAWNCNGLVPHSDELEVFIRQHNIDIILLSESHTTSESACKINNYKFYHTTHPANNARGGSAILIKDNIKHFEDIKIQTEKVQITTVTVQTESFPLKIASCYCPPSKTLNTDEYLDIFNILGSRFLIGGDFNAKHTNWGSRLITTKGKYLYYAMQRCKAEAISTRSPTYWPTDPLKIPDLLDFFIYKNLSANYMTVEDIFDLSSDHSAIFLTLSQHIILKKPNPVLVNKKTDWLSFKLSLAKKITLSGPLQSEEQIDYELEKLVNDIQHSAWENTPEINQKLSGVNYPREIVALVREKRKARKRWQRSRAPSDKTIFNRLVGKLRYEIKNLKRESINNYLRELTPDKHTDYSLWKATKSMKRPILQAPPLKSSDGTWIRENNNKASEFASHLANTFTPNQPTDYTDDLVVISHSNREYKIQGTTVREVERTIQKEINPKKAPGYDLITGLVLKQLPRIAIVKITQIINAAFKFLYVPQVWKIAEVIMIPKPGKPVNEITSYRPISLLPVLSKLFEKILNKRLLIIINDKKLIPNHQFGFRSQHNCIEQVHRLTNIIENAIENKQVCSGIFLDVAQAFDKVWHEGLNFKLTKLLPHDLAKILESYLSNRYFRVRQEDSYSELKPAKAGVPQGSVLGPILYLLYTSDMPENINNTTATFADDTAYLTVGDNTQETASKLNQTLCNFQRWAKMWRVKINEGKSVHVDFTNRNLPYMPTYFNNVVIPYSNQAKYLGMTLDTKLKWKEHVKKKKEQLNIKFSQMYWLIGRYSTLPVENKLLLYNQVLKPIWTYGIQLWGCTCRSNRLMIERFQNKVLRCIVDAPWYVRNDDLHRDLGIESVKDCISRFATAHQKRLKDHINPEATHLLRIDDMLRRLKRVKPHELI